MRRLARLWILAIVLAAPGLASAQGLLLPKEPGLGPLGIGHQRVKIEIRDGTAVTKVDQTFVNHTGRQLEAEYVFPLPKGAALQSFALWINGKKTRGEVLEKDKARSIYEGIVRRMQDPGLLEYVDHDVFKARVFPVPARGEQRIEISFSQVLDFADGVYTYRYPLGASKVSGAASVKTLKDFTFTASITSKLPVKSVYSPSHRVDVRRPDDHSAKLGFEALRESLDRDVVLYYTVGRGDVGMNLLTYATDDEPGYFLMMVAPKQEWQKKEIVGKLVTFVIDTSGSMSREKLTSAKQALKYCLARLHPEDRFNIVRFSTDTETFRSTPVSADEKNVSAAKRFVDDFYASGGTAIHEALTTALRDAAHRDGAPHLVVFLTDGEPTVGVTDENKIASEVKGLNQDTSRIFVFGVGNDLNATLLDRLAAESDASVEYARDGKDTEIKLSGFYNKIAFPVLTDVRIDLDGVRAFDIYPRTAPALFKGSQHIVVGRYRESGTHQVTLSGRTGDEARKFSEKLKFPKKSEEHDFIPRLWAVRKVGYLLEEIRINGEQQELREEVVRLGKKFGIVTPYTSYLVIEDEPVATTRPPPPRPPWGPRPRPRFDDAEGRVGGATTGRRSKAGSPAPMAAPEPAPEEEAKREALSSADAFAARTGEAGVSASAAVKDLKETQTATPSKSRAVRNAGSRTFVWKDGAWTDTEWKSDARVLEIKYLSDAYFALLRLRPEVKEALALGERVRVMLDGKRGVEIGPKGAASEAEVKRFVK